MSKKRPITIFAPSHAGDGATNAQPLTVKEIVARLPPERFQVTMSTIRSYPAWLTASNQNTALSPYASGPRHQ